MQRSTISLGGVLTVAGHADILSRKAELSICAPVDNDDLLKFDGRLARTDTKSLREVLVEESGRDEEMRKALLKRCNQLLEGMKND